MDWNPQKLVDNIGKADTDDLIDRITAYRAGMEPKAIELIEDELQRRGVTEASIDRYRRDCQAECLFYADGTAKVCSFCRKPAVAECWGWHRLMGKIPIVPRLLRYCSQHESI